MNLFRIINIRYVVAISCLIFTSVVSASGSIYITNITGLSVTIKCISENSYSYCYTPNGGGQNSDWSASTTPFYPSSIRTAVITYNSTGKKTISWQINTTVHKIKIELVNGFDITADAAIYGFNKQQLSNVSASTCANVCSSKEWCVSFDYFKNSSKCDLSDRRAEDVGGLRTFYLGNPYNHYSLKPTYEVNDYRTTKNAAISGYNNQHWRNVTPEACARKCSNRSWCKSFDYYKGKRRCDLSSKSDQSVVLKTNYSGDPYDHYSKK